MRFLVNMHHVPELDAEELAQDVLIKVHSKVRTFHNNGRAKLTTWVFEIANNCAVDFHRASRPQQDAFTEADLPVRWHGQFAGRNSAWLTWLQKELEKLSAEDQQILFWRANEITHAEIGGWLGINEGTVRTRHFRAKKRLLAADNQPEIPGVSPEQNISEVAVAHE